MFACCLCKCVLGVGWGRVGPKRRPGRRAPQCRRGGSRALVPAAADIRRGQPRPRGGVAQYHASIPRLACGVRCPGLTCVCVEGGMVHEYIVHAVLICMEVAHLPGKERGCGWGMCGVVWGDVGGGGAGARAAGGRQSTCCRHCSATPHPPPRNFHHQSTHHPSTSFSKPLASTHLLVGIKHAHAVAHARLPSILPHGGDAQRACLMQPGHRRRWQEASPATAWERTAVARRTGVRRSGTGFACAQGCSMSPAPSLTS